MSLEKSSALKINSAGWKVIEATLYRKSFYEFVKAAWHQVDQSEFVDAKYIEVVCDHCQWAVETGNSLVINIPPRHAKSKIVSVLLMAWVWTFKPDRTFLCATHTKDLTLRDSQLSRQLIKSNWYINLFGDVGFQADQDVKSRFVNNSFGSRQSISVNSGVTGDGADIRIIDDPVDASDSLNDDALEKANDWYDQTFSTRIKSPDYSPVIVVQQRLAQNDLSGHLIKRGWYVLSLPLEYDPNHPIETNTPIWNGDWRDKKGDLLCPERYGQKFVNDLKDVMGSQASGQLNQYPQSPEGDIITDSLIGYYNNIDCIGFEQLIIRADTAEKTGKKNAYSVFSLFGKKYGQNDLYVLDLVRVKQDIVDLEITARAFFKKHHNKRPNGNPAFSSFGIEDKSSGTQLIQIMRRKNYGVEAIQRGSTPSPDTPYQEKKKWQRFEQVANHLKLENAKILVPDEITAYTDGQWVNDFITELKAKQRGRDELGFSASAVAGINRAGNNISVNGDGNTTDTVINDVEQTADNGSTISGSGNYTEGLPVNPSDLVLTASSEPTDPEACTDANGDGFVDGQTGVLTVEECEGGEPVAMELITNAEQCTLAGGDAYRAINDGEDASIVDPDGDGFVCSDGNGGVLTMFTPEA